MSQIFGGCLCQKVRYKISYHPLSQGICYCHQCQKSGGVYGSPLLVLHREQLDCSRENLVSCQTRSDRGSLVTRNFCKDCGCHIFAEISDLVDIVTVRAGTLDDFGNFAPQYLVWTESAHASCPLPTHLQSFRQNAPPELLLGLK